MGLFGSGQDIDLDVELKLNQMMADLDDFAEKGMLAEKSLNDTEKRLTVSKDSVKESYSKWTLIESELDELRRQLAELEDKQVSNSADLKAKQKESLDLQESLDKCNLLLGRMERGYATTATSLKGSADAWVLELQNYHLTTSTIRGFRKFGPQLSITKLACVGDLHGWAPGLINIIKLIGHKVSILGQDLDDHAMSIRFQDPVKARNSGRDLPKVGLSSHPLRPNSSITPFFDIEFTNFNDCNNCLVIVGDMIDRGDHSELSLEVMRQMHIKAPGSLLSLVGNHEAWLIENDFKVWSSNEERYRMQGRARVGTTIYDPIITGHADLSQSMDYSFTILQGSLGAYLLTQHFSILECLDKSSQKKFSKMYESAFKAISVNQSKLRKAVLSGGWELHELGRMMLVKILDSSKAKPLPVPGAFSSIIIDENTFCHAEINGLSHSQVDFGNLLSDLSWCGQQITLKPTIVSNGIVLEAPLYHARLNEEEINIETSISLANQLLPQMKRYIHGHTVHSNDPIKTFDSLEIINLDMGMTPCYRNLWHDNPYDATVVPYYLEIELHEQKSHHNQDTLSKTDGELNE